MKLQKRQNFIKFINQQNPRDLNKQRDVAASKIKRAEQNHEVFRQVNKIEHR